MLVTTNDRLLAGTHEVKLVVGFSHPSLTMKLTETFYVTLLSPCIETIVTPNQVIPTQSYLFGDSALEYTF